MFDLFAHLGEISHTSEVSSQFEHNSQFVVEDNHICCWRRAGCEKCIVVCKVGVASVVDGKATIDYDKSVMWPGRELPSRGGVHRRGRVHDICRRAGELATLREWMLRDLVPGEEVLPLMGWILEVYRIGAKPGIWLREFINSISFEEFKRRGESSGAENS